jgi:hypothetical protein
MKEGPMEVGTAGHDISRYFCRDMAGNGREWTRSISLDESRFVPLAKPLREDQVVLRGKSFTHTRPYEFGDQETSDAEYYIDDSMMGVEKSDIGFRVVVELSVTTARY